MNGAEHEGLLTIFLAEAEELLHQLHEELAELRYGVDGQRLLNDLHRSFYTLQGGAAVMKLTPMSALAGRCEEVIERLRRRRLPMTPRVFSLLEAAAGELDNMVRMLVRGEPLDVDTQSLQNQLSESIQEGRNRVPEVSDDGEGTDPLQQFFESGAISSAIDNTGQTDLIPPAPARSPDLPEPRRPGSVALPGRRGAASVSADTVATDSPDWQPLKPAASHTIKPLPTLSVPAPSSSPPTSWRQLADAVVQAHRRHDLDALSASLDALADWLDRH